MLLNCSLRTLLRVPWTARRSNQSILKEISPEYSLEGLMLKLKLQYFGHPMWRADSLEKILMLGKIEGRRRRDNRGWGGWMASPTEWTWVWVNSGSWWWTGSLVCCSPWGHKELETTEQMNWTELYSPWNSPGQNTRVGSRSHLQGIFPTQGLNPGLLHCRVILYQLSHQEKPFLTIMRLNKN